MVEKNALLIGQLVQKERFVNWATGPETISSVVGSFVITLATTESQVLAYQFLLLIFYKSTDFFKLEKGD